MARVQVKIRYCCCCSLTVAAILIAIYTIVSYIQSYCTVQFFPTEKFLELVNSCLDKNYFYIFSTRSMGSIPRP